MPLDRGLTERYKADFDAVSLSDQGPVWLKEIRQNAISTFIKNGFPVTASGNERWRFTNINPIARGEFNFHRGTLLPDIPDHNVRNLVPWDDNWETLVFVDGSYSEILSNTHSSGIQVNNLADKLQEDGAAIRAHLGKYASIDEDGFTALNTSFLYDGAVIEIPENTHYVKPIHLVFISSGTIENAISCPRTLVLVGNRSSVTLLETYASLSKDQYFTNSVLEISSSRESSIEHFRYTIESPTAFHIGTTRVKLEENSTFKSTSIATGSRIARNDLNVLMDGVGASCILRGLYLTSGNQHLDNHINIDHSKASCSSDQYFKGVLSGQSRAVFSGRVLVRKDAQKTVAHQSDKNLILSEGARINTKPSLEIYADDIQATHGATAGAVAEDALFYMRSRGIDEQMARALLVAGFAGEIVDKIELGALREHVNRLISNDSETFSALT